MSVSCGHMNRWCLVVSLALLQRGHVGEVSDLILLRCSLSVVCCVLSRNMMFCCFLFSKLILSFLDGVGMYGNMHLPVDPKAH